MEARTDIRSQLLAEVVQFVDAAALIRGVQRIALLGSLVTETAAPKDVDLLVTVADDADLAPLAACARRLQGHTQSQRSGADVFLADRTGRYIGRTCPWRECGPGIRASCDAEHCGRRPYLHDDFGTITLPVSIVSDPPVDLWPSVVRRCELPEDVERMVAELE